MSLLKSEHIGSTFGNAQRDYAHIVAQGDCIVYMDDDDWPGKEAFSVLHKLEKNKDTVHFFRMRNRNIVYLSNIPLVGQMGGPQCVPPVREDLPLWMSNNIYEADGVFLCKCHDLYHPVYHDEVICYIRGSEWMS